jgi:hypothetical protein
MTVKAMIKKRVRVRIVVSLCLKPCAGVCAALLNQIYDLNASGHLRDKGKWFRAAGEMFRVASVVAAMIANAATEREQSQCDGCLTLSPRSNFPSELATAPSVSTQKAFKNDVESDKHADAQNNQDKPQRHEFPLSVRQRADLQGEVPCQHRDWSQDDDRN